MSIILRDRAQPNNRHFDDLATSAVKDKLSGKKNVQLKDPKSDQKGEEQKFLYEIELFSGGWIYTDNLTVTDDEVTYISNKGLIVSLNKEEVKTMRKKADKQF